MLTVLYCNADTFTQEKKHELQVLIAEDQPDIVAMTSQSKGAELQNRGYQDLGLYYI